MKLLLLRYFNGEEIAIKLYLNYIPVMSLKQDSPSKFSTLDSAWGFHIAG